MIRSEAIQQLASFPNPLGKLGNLTIQQYAKAMPVDLPCIALRHVMSDISVYKFYIVFDGVFTTMEC